MGNRMSETSSPDTVRIGLLIDVPHWGPTIGDVLWATFRMVEDEYRADVRIARSVE